MTHRATASLPDWLKEDDHIQGTPAAPAVLLEYADYECPYCDEAHHVIKQLQQSLGNQLCLVFRNFPLTTVHPHAQHAAEAAEAAGGQGKFWSMHDTLFENQGALDDESLLQYAAAIGLDLHRFTLDMIDHRYAPRVREDFLQGARSGVNGTPTFFINGVRHDGPFDFDSLMSVIEDTIES